MNLFGDFFVIIPKSHLLQFQSKLQVGFVRDGWGGGEDDRRRSTCRMMRSRYLNNLHTAATQSVGSCLVVVVFLCVCVCVCGFVCLFV